MNLSLILCIITIIFLIIYIHLKSNTCNYTNDDIIVEKYKIKTKKIEDSNDKYNIKQYDIINDNVIIHNKFKNELLNLQNYKHAIEKQQQCNKNKLLEQRKHQIQINSKKIRNYEFKQKIYNIKLNIQSLKLLLKNELASFLTDYNKDLISQDEIKKIINNLKIDYNNNHKLLDIKNDNDIDIDQNDKEEYIKLINIKSELINKKINIYTKFLK